MPYYGDLDGYGKAEMVVTTTDGYINAYRFNRGDVLVEPNYLPGNSRWKGRQEKAPR